MSTTQKQTLIAPGIMRYDALDTGLVRYIISNVTPDAIEALMHDHHEIIANWNPAAPLYLLHEITVRRRFVTPRLNLHLADLSRQIKAHRITVCSAVVIPDAAVFRHATLSGLMLVRHVGRSRQQYFRQQEAALAWLKEQMPVR